MATDISKKDQLLMAIESENWKKSLQIAKSFRRDFNEEGQRIIQIAHETFDNKSRTEFYKSLGVNIELCLNKAIEELMQWEEKYKNNESNN